MTGHSMFKKLPSDICSAWSDDERMDFMFSAFPPSSADNPEHWKSKMDFWESLILDLYQHSTSVCLEFHAFSSVLTKNGRLPLGLNVVWESMIEQKTIVPVTEYVQDISMNSSWVGWGLNSFVRKPIKWLVDKSLSPLKQKRAVQGYYLSVRAFEAKCNEVVSSLRNADNAFTLSECVHAMTYDCLLKSVERVSNDQKSIDLILASLEKQRKLVVFRIDASDQTRSDSPLPSLKKFVAFSSRGQPVGDVSDDEMSVVKLWWSRLTLEEDIRSTYSQLTDLAALARKCVKQNQRVLAVNALRQKQRLTKGLVRKEMYLNQLDEILDRIGQAKVNALTLSAYKAGVSAYDRFAKEKDLSPERAEETIAEVQRMLDDHNEIADTLASSTGDCNDLDEVCEKELNELLRDDKDDAVADLVNDTEGLKLEDVPLPDVPREAVPTGAADKPFTCHAAGAV